jgi:hypothetical protein
MNELVLLTTLMIASLSTAWIKEEPCHWLKLRMERSLGLGL